MINWLWVKLCEPFLNIFDCVLLDVYNLQLCVNFAILKFVLLLSHGKITKN